MAHACTPATSTTCSARCHVEASIERRGNEIVDQTITSPRRSHKRDVSEWIVLLEELTMELATGLLYNRDLPTIDDAMRNLVDHYLRRVDDSNR